ncbi:hypothetical protein RQP46_008054 [Phenoliferia psychrophenolica]
MATFASLPPELVQLVLDDVSLTATSERHAPMWSATLVSRAWHQIAQPMLYTHITLLSEGKSADRWIRSPARLRHPPMSLMLHDVGDGPASEDEEESEDIDSEDEDEDESDEEEGSEEDEESGSGSDEEESVAGEADVGRDNNDTDVPELPPLPDPHNESSGVHRMLRVCEGLRELQLAISTEHHGLFWNALAEPSLAGLTRLEIEQPDCLRRPHDIPTLPFQLSTLVLDVFEFHNIIPHHFYHALFTSSSSTLKTLILRNQERRKASFFDAISPSFHLIAANLTHLFLPVYEPKLSPLLAQCTSLTSIVVPVDTHQPLGHLVTILAHLPNPPTLTHLTASVATFSHLAPELLLHILKLSNEGKPAKERQRFRLAFGLISRACFLATADSTEYCVEGVAQAKGFLAQLEQEEGNNRATQEERKARTGRPLHAALISVTRRVNVRRLTLTVVDANDQKAFVDLLRATPNLIVLELVVGVFSASYISSQLAIDLGGLRGLQELRVHAKYVEGVHLLQFLSPLQALEVLDLEGQNLRRFEIKHNPHFNSLALPRLRTLRINLMERADDFPSTVFAKLAARSTTGIQELDLKSTPLSFLKSKVVEPLLPHIINLVHLSWDAPHDLLLKSTQDTLLALLGALEKLEYISIPMWNVAADMVLDVPFDKQPLDHTLFDTLATLPSLHTVVLNVEEGNLSSSHVISFLDSHKPLRFLSIHFLQGTWTREERDAVEKAADQAGVAFS